MGTIVSRIFAVGVIIACTCGARLNAADGMTVHEWGTFTSLQDEHGNAIGGINTDDEPVPKFVHRLAQFLLLSPTEVPPIFFQGAPRCHPDVTMRLETPVIYFHPAQGAGVQTVNVDVKFPGGWLSEFYPDAQAVAPGLTQGQFKFGPLNSNVVSELHWKDLNVGVTNNGPETKAHVWLSPRAVEAASLQMPNSESEKFLFYRGVAHLNSPLRVSRAALGGKFILQSNLDPSLRIASLNISNAWLVDIRKDGRLAFRTVPAFEIAGNTNTTIGKIPSDFVESDYAASNLQVLRNSLRSALVANGLFGDEADALLNTWELSYFKSAGERLFYLVPQAWTDAVLPLQISNVPQITRIMVGRTELVTPSQRELLAQMAAASTATLEADQKNLRERYYQQLGSQNRRVEDSQGRGIENVNRGENSLTAIDVKSPSTYQRYLDLGRFRNTLLLDEQQRRPSPSLQKFIQLYSLTAYNTQ